MSNQPPPPPASDDSFGAPPPPADGASATTAGAEVGPRAGARLVDHIGLAIVNAIITFVVVATLLFSSSNMGVTGGFFTSNLSPAGITATVIGLVILFGYFVGMEVTSGATLGKMLVGEKVVGAGGGNPTPEESFKRNSWMLLTIVPFIGGLLQLVAAGYILYTISDDPHNLGWHDKFSGTRVVRTK